MASILTKVLSGLTPPPFVNPEDYDGWEFRWKFFVFRPALLKNELLLLTGLLVYIGFIFYGKSSNESKAKKWLNAHLPILQLQFSKPEGKSGLTSDGYSDFFNFSTGRRNITSLHTIFTLRPRHDFFQWVFQTGRTLVDLQYRPRDDIQLDFKLAPGALPNDFVWAIVAKDELLSVKDGRWDLTFAKTSENAALPPTLLVMSEFADVTDNLLKPSGVFSIATVLQDPKILPHFRSLSITDQPRDRPDAPLPTEKREKHVILSLTAPSGSHVTDTVPLVAAMFQFIDSLNKINLRPETKNKLKKIREDLDKTLKEDSEKEKKEELSQAAEDKKAAKRKAEEERIAKLPAAEQRKILEKERKRTLRKSQGKTVRK
ncbi:hypothetical protein BDQ12DRAFT_675096 [Crucibulum laeve]|uniref:DUF1682-domain-containing protein n=1 Tax=Crucibulum laeve TaxID=68775 RepID=A0A5C3MFV4_9AGAR|nr:hypothetical protein BDQ12DRAFT_675096 [Crucibulum laeve]